MIRYDGFSIDPDAGIVYGAKGRPLGNRDCRQGYVTVGRWTGEKVHSVRSHRLIWESVHGPIPPGMQINHINGDKGDNRIANLEVVTPSENIRHAYRTGLKSSAGEKHPSHRLTVEDVQQIRSDYAAGGIRQADLAIRYGVNRRHVGDIVRRIKWKSVV